MRDSFPANLLARLMLFLSIILIQIFLTINSVNAGETAEQPYDFANSPLPIWSQLSEFETNFIYNRQSEDNAESLLALYLIASGNIRQRSDYLKINRKIDQWIGSLTDVLNSLPTSKEKASQLHQAMHQDFFLANTSSTDANNGYDAEQSQISEIFSTKKYNCVSASLLYSVLASKIGLRARGVLMPSHVFIELELAGKVLVEVETTSATGFGWEHDEAFYQQKQSDTWFSQRGLIPSSFADYQSREIVSAFQLGVHNMRNQHVQASRMEYYDRMRLVELFSYFQPDNLDAHKHRLSFYTREYSRLRDLEDFEMLDKLFSQLSDYFNELTHNPKIDLEIKNMLGWMYSQYAIVALQLHKEMLALEIITTQLQNLDNGIEDYSKIQNNLYFVLSSMIKDMSSRSLFVEAETTLLVVDFECNRRSSCQSIYQQLYAEWASHFWSIADWPAVIAKNQFAMEMNNDSEVAKVLEKNSLNAYLNWSQSKMIEGDWLGASEVLLQCTQTLNNSETCQLRLAELKAQYFSF